MTAELSVGLHVHDYMMMITTIVISFNSVIFMLNNYIKKHFLSIGYWYWVLVSPGTNNIGYWVLGGFLGIVLTLPTAMIHQHKIVDLDEDDPKNLFVVQTPKVHCTPSKDIKNLDLI